MVTAADLRRSGWPVPDGFLDGLSDSELEFVRLEFTGLRTLAYYRERLRYLGYCSMDSVLDAGCGMGQWSFALSGGNRHVCGVDLNPDRIRLAARLASGSGARNTVFQRGRLESLPYVACSFDAIFCYGVFMFTNMPGTLAEFYRVLKEGGKLYVNANSYGWYVHLLRDVPHNRRPALRIIKNTLLARKQAIIVREGWLRAQLGRHGFRVIDVACEGDASFGERVEAAKPAPAYPRRYWGLRGVIEALAVKSTATRIAG